MRWNIVFAIVYKDWEETLKSKPTLLSIVLPFLFPILVPIVLIASVTVFGLDIYKYISFEELVSLYYVFPETVGMSKEEIFLFIISIFVIPLLFIVFSLASTSIITAHIFAGEKERKTAESLLATTIENDELVMGKVLATLIPSIILTYLTFAICSVLVNLLTFNVFNGIWFPSVEVIISVMLIAPLYAFLGMTLVVWGSMRSSSITDANNYAGVLIIPMLLFILTVLIGNIVVDIIFLIIVSLILLVIDIATFKLVYSSFNREHFLTSV